MRKRFVIDTSVLIYDVDSLYKFGANDVIIPSIVCEEINLLKEEDSEAGYCAKKISNLLESISRQKPLKDGVWLGETFIKTSYNLHNKEVEGSLIMKNHDYKIISCAKNHQAILVTRNEMLRVIARDFVETEDYKADKLSVKEIYKGYRKVLVNEEVIYQLYSGKLENCYGLYPNEFVIFVNEENEKHTGIGIMKNNRILPVDFTKINKQGLNLKLNTLNLEQKMLMYLLLDENIICVTVSGVSGKGKTLLSIDYALASVFAGLYNQFLYAKSAIAVDRREYLGFDPGDRTEKFFPHCQPLLNSIEFIYQKELYKKNKRITVEEKVEQLIHDDVLKLYPLANIRGMSVFNKVVILDEGQNTTNHMIKSLVTRMNDNSKLIVTGDIEQIDDPNLNKYNNGLVHLIEEGKTEDFIGHITMDIDQESKRGKLASFGAKKL